ncbi:MAG: serine hydrolase [Cyanobacteria bacterium J06635_15]
MSDYGDGPLRPVSDHRAQGMRPSRSPSVPPLPRSQSASSPYSGDSHPYSGDSQQSSGTGSEFGASRYDQAYAAHQRNSQGTQPSRPPGTNSNYGLTPDQGAPPPTAPPKVPVRRAKDYPRSSRQTAGASGFSLRRWLAGGKPTQRPRRSEPRDSSRLGHDGQRPDPEGHLHGRDGQRAAQGSYRVNSMRQSPPAVVPPRRQLKVPAAPQSDPNSGIQPATSFDLSSTGTRVGLANGSPSPQTQGNGNYYQDPRYGDPYRQSQSPQYPSPYSPAPTAQPSPNRHRHLSPQPPALQSPTSQASAPQAPQFQNKVTPLRPRGERPLSTPEASPYRSPNDRSREDRLPRRTPRRTQPLLPRPLLIPIRLLILGVGLAAIAGTLLSILSPEQADYAQNTGAPPPSAEATATEAANTSQSPGFSANALPLGTELVHVQDTLEELVTLTPGLTQSVFMVNLDSGAYVDVDGSQSMPAASTIKVPILVAFLQAVDRGTIRLDQSLTLNQEDLATGSGDLQNQPVGSQYSALEVASLMIITSDNTATNMIIQLLGGQDGLNRQFRDWGLTETVLRNPLPDLSGTNTTSTQDLASLMARIDQGQLLELRSRDRLFSIMQRTKSRNLIPSGVGTEALIANKTGDIASTLGDVALIDLPNGTRYALAVLTTRPDNDGRARELIRRVSQEVYQELKQPTAPTGGEPPVEVPNVESEGSLVPQG